jgi:hypothetical protein
VIDPATDMIIDKVTLQDNQGPGARVRYSPEGVTIVTDSGREQLVNVIKASDLHGKQFVIPVGKAPMAPASPRTTAPQSSATMATAPSQSSI